MKSAFTLVELLVVISIIALLTSILLPVLGRARSGAKSIQCSGNQRQIGGALMLYRDDYQDIIPPWRDDADGNAITCAWAPRLLPYVGRTPKSWYCPDSPAALRPVDDSVASMINTMNIGINGADGANEKSFFRTAIKGSVVRQPSLLVYSGDGAGTSASDYNPPNGNSWCYINPGNIWPFVPNGWVLRHLGAVNFLFVDGHVEKVPRQTLVNWNSNIYTTANKPRWFAIYK